MILNNAIGVGEDGTTLVGNGGDGILVDGALGAIVGGSDPNQANVIGGNEANGIETMGGTGGILVEGNFIGTDSTGKLLNLGNRENGIQLASSSNTIGGTGASAANTIDFNGSGQVGSGVQLVGSANQNAILSNSIFGNAGLGINLGDGPTPNHAPGTPGPNNYQNYPTLSSSQSDGSSITTINGSLYSIANTTFLIQFFASPNAGLDGFGQGKNLIGSQSVQTDANGNVAFTVPIPSGTAAGQYISATATDPDGNTSEFSADVRVQPEINLNLSASATPNPVAAGGELTYTISVTNSGDLAANNVTLTDQLPGSVSVVSASVSLGTNRADHGVHCDGLRGHAGAGRHGDVDDRGRDDGKLGRHHHRLGRRFRASKPTRRLATLTRRSSRRSWRPPISPWLDREPDVRPGRGRPHRYVHDLQSRA